MRRGPWWGVVALLLASAALAAPARALTCEEHSFAVADRGTTAWRICFDILADNPFPIGEQEGLVIRSAHFRTAPEKPWVKVIHDMRVSEILVPYHGNEHRFFDLSGLFFTWAMLNLTEADCPAAVGGSRPLPQVCREVRDRGLIWRNSSNPLGAPFRNQTQRGREVVYWGAMAAANYRYVMEYAFRDDGVIIGRVGATGQNYPGSETVAHAHTPVWRIDIDLGAATPNAVQRWRHYELVSCEGAAQPATHACDVPTPINTATPLTWSASLHDILEVTNPDVKNARGHPIGYRLMPLLSAAGMVRHDEAFTRQEYWVTLYQRVGIVAWNAEFLPAYVAGAPSVQGQDVVLWVKGSAHHHPRDEDGVFNQAGFWVGTTHLMWAGFMLHPHNLFDCSPFYGACPPPPAVRAAAEASPHGGPPAMRPAPRLRREPAPTPR
jgi:Copper amine oxidase, enzyme domain